MSRRDKRTKPSRLQAREDSSSSPRRATRPMDRPMKMKDWLHEKLLTNEMPEHIWWVDHGKSTKFAVKWSHASNQAYRIEDSNLFKAWAVHSGTYKEGDAVNSYQLWKSNFRSALSSLPDVELVEKTKGEDAVRIYKFLKMTREQTPEESGASSTGCTGRRKRGAEVHQQKEKQQRQGNSGLTVSSTSHPAGDTSRSPGHTSHSRGDTNHSTEDTSPAPGDTRRTAGDARHTPGDTSRLSSNTKPQSWPSGTLPKSSPCLSRDINQPSASPQSSSSSLPDDAKKELYRILTEPKDFLWIDGKKFPLSGGQMPQSSLPEIPVPVAFRSSIGDHRDGSTTVEQATDAKKTDNFFYVNTTLCCGSLMSQKHSASSITTTTTTIITTATSTAAASISDQQSSIIRYNPSISTTSGTSQLSFSPLPPLSQPPPPLPPTTISRSTTVIPSSSSLSKATAASLCPSPAGSLPMLPSFSSFHDFQTVSPDVATSSQLFSDPVASSVSAVDEGATTLPHSDDCQRVLFTAPASAEHGLGSSRSDDLGFNPATPTSTGSYSGPPIFIVDSFLCNSEYDTADSTSMSMFPASGLPANSVLLVSDASLNDSSEMELEVKMEIGQEVLSSSTVGPGSHLQAMQDQQQQGMTSMDTRAEGEAMDPIPAEEVETILNDEGFPFEVFGQPGEQHGHP